MISPALKELLEAANDIGIFLTLLCAAVAALSWYVGRAKRKAAAELAVAQINKMATNDFPHIHDESVKTNVHLTQQTVLLQDMRDGIIKLVDRTERVG
jgi:hypothetical protein